MEEAHKIDVPLSLAEANRAAEQLKSDTEKSDLELCVLLADLRRLTYDCIRRLHADQNTLYASEMRYVQKLRQKQLLLQQKSKQLTEVAKLKQQLDSSELEPLCRKYDVAYSKPSTQNSETEFLAEIKNQREKVRQKAIAKESLDLDIEKRRRQARRFEDQVASPQATYNMWLRELVSTTKRMHNFLQTQKSALLNPDKAEPERVHKARSERRGRRNDSARRDDRSRKRRYA